MAAPRYLPIAHIGATELITKDRQSFRMPL
ncbi:hypothetical protein PVAP13_1KG161537 [Panicum virgatum]|uniref:Uncharacterized protein n=1 Tax=Panicum virgatum TaxID=38727 RepID=A0A8T0XFD0_PANVG|nr:hypothetical protein PVAP13_1KG161537 [Panicum virgatum]